MPWRNRPSDAPRNVGMLGMHGNYGPNIKNKECDLLVAVGMRFDDRVTGDPAAFGPNARIIHMEIKHPSRIDSLTTFLLIQFHHSIHINDQLHL